MSNEIKRYYLEFGWDQSRFLATWKVADLQGVVISDNQEFVQALGILQIFINSSGFVRDLQDNKVTLEHGYEDLVEDPNKPDLPASTDGFVGNFFLELGWNPEKKQPIWKFRNMQGKPIGPEELPEACNQLRRVLVLLVSVWNQNNGIPATHVDMVSFDEDLPVHMRREAVEQAREQRELGGCSEEEMNIPVDLDYSESNLQPPYTEDRSRPSDWERRTMIIRDRHTGDHIARVERNLQNDFSCWMYWQELPESYVQSVTEPNKESKGSCHGPELPGMIQYAREICLENRIRRQRRQIERSYTGQDLEDLYDIPEDDTGHITLAMEWDIDEPDSQGKIPRMGARTGHKSRNLDIGHIDQIGENLFVGTVYAIDPGENTQAYQSPEWQTPQGTIKEVRKSMSDKHLEIRKERYTHEVREWKKTYLQKEG